MRGRWTKIAQEKSEDRRQKSEEEKEAMESISTPNIRTFQVFPDVPEPLAPLMELAQNLWWVWQPDGVELFRRLDRKLWDSVQHNPVKLLGTIEQSKLMAAAQDDGYLAHMKRVHEAFKQHLAE